jgi:hypothetical protein
MIATFEQEVRKDKQRIVDEAQHYCCARIVRKQHINREDTNGIR